MLFTAKDLHKLIMIMRGGLLPDMHIKLHQAHRYTVSEEICGSHNQAHSEEP